MIETKAAWKNLKGVTEWLPELKQLLAEAQEAALVSDIKPRLRVAAFLTGFIQESWPQSAEMDKLDDLAGETVSDLMIATIEDRLAAIARRTADFVKVEKDLNAAAERGESLAEAIRLEHIRSVIDATTQTIASAKALAAALNESEVDQKKLAARISKTIRAIEELRTEVAGLM
jgi:hypothetical protein